MIHIASASIVSAAVRNAADVCRHFKSQGWHTLFLTRGSRQVDAFLRDAASSVKHAPLRGIFDFASVLKLRNMLKRMPNDEKIIIHAHRYRDAYIALAARRLSGRKDIKVVSTRHKAGRGRNTRLFRRIYRNVDAHIFISELAKERFLSAWPVGEAPVKPERLHILYTSVNKDTADMISDSPDKGPCVALFRGSLRKGQGLETLIDAMSLLKNEKVRLHIVGIGDPDYVDSLRERAQNRKVMDKIDWRRPADDFAEDMRKAHFGVAPANMDWAAGHDNVLFMAVGKAHIATRCGAPAEFLTHGHDALLVASDSASALADAMSELAQEKELREKIGASALHTFTQRMSWATYTTRLKNLYLQAQ